MRIIKIIEYPIQDVKKVIFTRFQDSRGYFSEIYKVSDFQNIPELSFVKKYDFVQSNESYSYKGVLRGLHIQWNPFQGKLIRTLFGRMIDYFVDLRIDSPTFAKAYMIDMPSNNDLPFSEWLWLPPGIAHGNFFTENTKIEYFCTGEYNPKSEASINPLCNEIDFSFCENELIELFRSIIKSNPNISPKDLNGYSINEWISKPESNLFSIGKEI